MQNETKFTPGPWSAWLGRGGHSRTGPAAAAAHLFVSEHKKSPYGAFVEMSSKSMECPCIALGDTKERAEANARLIAAAPELYDALAQWQAADREYDPRERMNARRARDAALAKARGEA